MASFLLAFALQLDTFQLFKRISSDPDLRNQLVKAGVEKSRLVAKGYGPDKPIADNESEEGRDQNRRVEFNIVKQGQKKTLVEDED